MAYDAVIFDVMPDVEDESMKKTNYDLVELVPFIGFQSLIQDGSGSYSVDDRCLEKSNFRKLKTHVDLWSRLGVQMDEMVYLKVTNVATGFGFHNRLVDLNDVSKPATGLIFMAIFLTSGQRFLLGFSMYRDENPVK
jgi:hypothetical protein